jgi:hypothetical protein
MSSTTMKETLDPTAEWRYWRWRSGREMAAEETKE